MKNLKNLKCKFLLGSLSAEQSASCTVCSFLTWMEVDAELRIRNTTVSSLELDF